MVDAEPANVEITLNPVNDAPVATDDSAVTDEDTILITGNVLVNDDDVDGDTLEVATVTQPAYGSVVDNGDGTFTYSPSLNYNGADSFSYMVSDGNGATDTATVAVTITPVNDIPVADAQAVTTDEDIEIAITLIGSDVDSDPLTYQMLSQPANGILSGIVPSLTYTPNQDHNGSDSFSFVANDGKLDSAPAIVSIIIIPVNDDPVATDDTAATDEDTSVITANLLANDSDVDGDSLAVTSLTQPGHGSVVDNGNGTFTYSPALNYNGADSFTYKVSDGNDGTDTATVAVAIAAVNDIPIATAQAVTTDEDNTFSITLSGSDVDGDPLTYQVVTSPANGVLSGSAPNLTYTPNQDYNGSDSFGFMVNDGELDSEIATVAITVNPVNDPPIANAGSDQEVYKGDTVILDGSNSSDVDGDILAYQWSIVSAPAGSRAVISDSSLASPTLIPDVAGSYELQLLVNDGTTDSVADTLAITANLRLVAVPAVVGLAQVAAESAITSANLIVGPVTTQHDDRMPAGYVLSQNPASRTSVEEGSTVDLVVSLGPVLLPTITLSAEPSTIVSGGSTTLIWSTTNADSVSIDLHGQSTAVALSGSMSFGRISATTTYTMTATGPGGTTTESATVTVQAPSNPPTIDISANPSTIDSGGSTTLTWTTANADSVVLDYSGGPMPLALNGSIAFYHITTTRTYTLTATGSGGTATESVTIFVETPLPRIREFTASPSAILPGQYSTLTWDVQGATSVIIDNGIGPVPAATVWWWGRLIYPSETTTYTMTASNSGGTTTASVTVIVSDLAVSIIEPSNNSYISGRYVTVRGTINSLTNAKFGVTVNGMPALVDGNTYIANHVPLQDGDNTISVNAIDIEGKASATEIIVLADTASEYIKLAADREAGMSLFNTTVSVDASFGFSGQPVITYDGPGVMSIQPTEDNDNFQVSATEEGLYTLTAEVYDSDGTQYYDTLSLLVLDRIELDTLLQAKWDEMALALEQQQIDKALSFFEERSQQIYRKQYTALAPVLGDIAAEYQAAELLMVDADNSTATYEILTVREGLGYSFHLMFVKDSKGLWKIWRF